MISVIITGAGNGSRFGCDKLLTPIEKKPLIVRTVEQFDKVNKINEIIVVTQKNKIKELNQIFKKNNLKVTLVEGGKTRYISAYNGIKHCRGKYVVIHDGARPLTPTKIIDRVCDEVIKHHAVITAVEAYTSVKITKCTLSMKNPSDLFVEKNLKRSKTWLAQTPQAYKKDIIYAAYEKAIATNSNGMDDSELVGATGIKVKIIPGDTVNMKVTYPLDMIIARELYKASNGGANV